MFKSRRFWLIAGVLVIVIAVGAVIAARVLSARQQFAAGGASGAASTGEVTTITALTTVETSGGVSALQSTSLSWSTTGKVSTVAVNVGDQVSAGEVLMALDPASAPQNVVLAQVDLITAKKNLDDLLHPSALILANAQKAVVDAQDALTKAEKDLRNAQNPVGQNLYDSVADAELALTTSQATLQLTNVSQDASAYQNAVFITNWYRRHLEELQTQLANDSGNQALKDQVEQAQNTYQAKLSEQLTLQLRITTDQANKADAVAKAQDKLDTAQANLNSALAGPDATKVTSAQAKVAVAEAVLAEAQQKLAKLTQPDPNDVAVAQARVQAAQMAVNALNLTAPFDGEVLTINYLPGDSVSPNQVAIVLANRSQLHVDVLVDESDIGTVAVGQAVTATFDAIPELTLAGTVAQINPVGQASQGLIKYVVRVDLAETDPRVLLSMTANIVIVTKVEAGMLAVPLDAVQLDGQGEFVNRITATGQIERVNVVSGQTQDDIVIVAGDLKPGDQVQLFIPVPTNNGGPFGGG